MPESNWPNTFATNDVQYSASSADRKEAMGIVCYGMIENIPVSTIPNATIINETSLIDAYLNEDRIVQRSSDGVVVGILDEKSTNCLFKLAREEIWGKRAAALVSANIYGPKDLADDVGVFLDTCNFYLQDPIACNMNAPYMNPHCLSMLFEPPSMTFDLQKHASYNVTEFSATESLQIIGTAETLPEEKQPIGLQTELCRHQKQALSFFLNRESGQPSQQAWAKAIRANGSLFYTNAITNAHQDTPPPLWSGGILADEMGLGKTLQMLSLIAWDKEFQQQSRHIHKEVICKSRLRNGSESTLIIIPLALMGVWDYQIKHHIRPGILTWTKHYGVSRIIKDGGSRLPDIVITTYSTVTSEYKGRYKRDSALFGFHWRRVILDEAHIIRNLRTQTSNAVCTLEASSRWAVSGTPIQNSLEDLVGLLRFLRFQPYDDAKVFDRDIVNYFREGNIVEGTRRLKALCDPIMIRRPKAVISLPPRQDLLKTVDFSPEEMKEYFKIEGRLKTMREEEENTNVTEGFAFMSTIQLIGKLRIFCDLGLSTKAVTLSADRCQISVTPERRDSTEAIVASELGLGGVKCAECKNVINIPDTPISRKISPYAYYSSCRLVHCQFCAEIKSYQLTGCGCSGDVSQCLLSAVSPALVQEVQYGQSPTLNVSGPFSSKVKALVQEILSCLSEKSVVLSFWTASLTMAQQALEVAGIRCTRIDGSIPQPERERRLRLFRTDPTIKVILLTVSCGGVGLDLTAASRVHLLEPQWNPAVEDQALARVHRMGQQRPVVATRYVMKHSIEESILLIKDKKQMLAELLPRTTCKMDVENSP